MAKKKLTAANADKYELYIKAVQCVEIEIDFVCETFAKLRGQSPISLREDFCGAFAAAAEFVGRSAKNRAFALDLDPEVLAWGKAHILIKLPSARRKNLKILRQNVISHTSPVDVILAMNFSYFIFKSRELLRDYFTAAHQSLTDHGMFFLDCYGGSESQRIARDKKKCDGFTYIWEQASYNPINNETMTHIHFYFPDRTRIMRAFSYDWRLWTPQEICEILREAGFSKSAVYWEEWNAETNEGTGVFLPTEVAENCEAWVAYIVAEK